MKKIILPLVLSISALFYPMVPNAHADFIDTKEDSILYFQSHGIIKGYDDGTFRPEARINRAEFIKILVESKGMQNVTYQPKCFPDIPENAWFEKYVCIGKELQLIQGYDDGTFRPGNEVTKAEAVKMLLGIVNEDVSAVKLPYKDVEKNSWYYPFLLLAFDKGFIDTAKNFYPHTPSTRKEITELLFRQTLSNTMPIYAGTCARPATLASCARDFFTIEKMAKEATIDSTTPQITTASGTTFGIVKLEPTLELQTNYPDYPMIHQFSAEEILCLIRVTSTGEKSFRWWSEHGAHHGIIAPKFTKEQDGQILLHMDIDYTYLVDSGFLYSLDEETLRLDRK